jgi:hypothetical protein
VPEGPDVLQSNDTFASWLVEAHRQRRIESGRTKSITDLAAQEDVTDAYVCRLLSLTCLAPDIVEAILKGRQPKSSSSPSCSAASHSSGRSNGAFGLTRVGISAVMVRWADV